MRTNLRRGTRRQRGATMVEYALALVLLIVSTVGAVRALESSASSEVNNQASCVSERPPPVSCVRRAVTTTTAPSGPPTTAPPPPVLITITPTWGATSVSGSGATAWAFDQVVNIATAPPSPAPVENALVRIRIDLVPPAGGTQQPPFFVSCTTNAAGTCSIHFDVPVDQTPGASISIAQVTPSDGGQQTGTLPASVPLTAPP